MFTKDWHTSGCVLDFIKQMTYSAGFYLLFNKSTGRFQFSDISGLVNEKVMHAYVAILLYFVY